MGRFLYDNGIKVELEDRLLAHLQLVIGTKLRRNEPFFFTWKEDVSLGSGRTSVWLHRGANLVFKFAGGRSPRINPQWVDELAFNANSPRGLYITREPDGTGTVSTTETRAADLVP